MADIQPPTLSKIQKGQRGVTPANRDKLARVLRVPGSAFYEPIGTPVPPEPAGLPLAFSPDSDVQPAFDIPPPQPRRVGLNAQVPVMGTAEGGVDGFFEINLTEGPVEFVDIPPGLTGVAQGDLFAIRVHGESMMPVWEAGDPVFIVKSRPRKRGSYVVVQMEGGRGHQPRAILKRLVSEDSERILLAQFNPPMEMEVDRSEVKHIWRALHWRELQG